MKIGISGFFGRMGQEIANIVINDPALKLVAEIDKNHNVIKETPDIWIDFSAEVALLTLLESIDAKTKLVSGTTGISQETFEKIKKSGKTVIWGSNMSFGVNLLFALAKSLAAKLPKEEYDAEIYERHHRMKKDAPSGTALTIGQNVADGRNLDFEKVKRDYGIQGERRLGEIGFAVERGGLTIGHHELAFVSDLERIWVGHEAFDRKIFAEGAVKIAKIVHEQNITGYNHVHDILKNHYDL
jgi:4-hydroxy-tetrahydrodipicolinate reductase